MTTIANSSKSAKAEKQLSQLIRLKRLERPDPEFWQQFEQDFRSRQLTTFVRIQPLHTRLRKACLILARKAAPPVAAAGAVALTFLAISNTSYLISSNTEDAAESATAPAPPLSSQIQDSYFVVQGQEPTELSDNREASFSGTVYQVNLLETVGEPQGYEVKATPVIFRLGKVEQSFGAKVISTQPDR